VTVHAQFQDLKVQVLAIIFFPSPLPPPSLPLRLPLFYSAVELLFLACPKAFDKCPCSFFQCMCSWMLLANPFPLFCPHGPVTCFFFRHLTGILGRGGQDGCDIPYFFQTRFPPPAGSSFNPFSPCLTWCPLLPPPLGSVSWRFRSDEGRRVTLPGSRSL